MPLFCKLKAAKPRSARQLIKRQLLSAERLSTTRGLRNIKDSLKVEWEGGIAIRSGHVKLRLFFIEQQDRGARNMGYGRD